MTIKDEALKLALEILHYLEALNSDTQRQKMEAITAIKQALAAPVQEPVAWIRTDLHGDTTLEWEKDEDLDGAFYDYQPLYTTPPAAQRQWVGLTQDEFRDFASTLDYGTGGLIQAVEAELKEKNT